MRLRKACAPPLVVWLCSIYTPIQQGRPSIQHSGEHCRSPAQWGKHCRSPQSAKNSVVLPRVPITLGEVGEEFRAREAERICIVDFLYLAIVSFEAGKEDATRVAIFVEVGQGLAWEGSEDALSEIGFRKDKVTLAARTGTPQV